MFAVVLTCGDFPQLAGELTEKQIGIAARLCLNAYLKTAVLGLGI